MKKLALLVTVLLLLVITVGMSVANAAPRAELFGAEPLWDSGWVLTTEGEQTFDHDLAAYPTLWVLTVADDHTGEAATKSPDTFIYGTAWHGHLVTGIYLCKLEVKWRPDGIGYSKHLNKWYQRGADYARLRIFAADDP